MQTPDPARRQFLRIAAGSALAPLALTPLAAQDTSAAAASATPPAAPKAAPKNSPAPRPPKLPDDQVQAVVTHAHRSLEKVGELLEATPTLANATWDWGGGDFETPLQAAAHIGQRAIAEYLLAHGARFDLYAAAMLGQLDRVQAALGRDVVAAAVVPGPHGFTLLHCAKQGGAEAKPVYDWLLAQGVPEKFTLPLPYRWPAGTAPTPAK
ncbi:MAG: hypothetical protein RLZZ15_4401 [Verrucomicrobiota bacterium]|jgi:hypothetical protein